LSCCSSLPLGLRCPCCRFDFDLERLEPVKYNDEFRFPNELDMGPYTSEGVEAKEAIERGETAQIPEHMYTLTGVVVHSGQCGGGHYYSFSRERRATGRLSERKAWVKFDDSLVCLRTPWHSTALSHCTPKHVPNSRRRAGASQVTEVNMDSEAKREREWYGGEYVDQVYDRQFQRTMNKTMERSWNAYMLIYEPLDPTSMETESDVSVAGLSVSDEAVADPSISRLVLKHNIEFNHIRNIFNVYHFKSVGDHSQLSVHVWPSPLMLWPCVPSSSDTADTPLQVYAGPLPQQCPVDSTNGRNSSGRSHNDLDRYDLRRCT